MIPQAWQAAWQPPRPWTYAGPSPDRPGLELWDARTVPVCRTGHGNIHYYLVAAMRQLAANPGIDFAEAIGRATAVLLAGGVPVVTVDAEVAVRGAARFTLAGGDLRYLTGRGLWGEI